MTDTEFSPEFIEKIGKAISARRRDSFPPPDEDVQRFIVTQMMARGIVKGEPISALDIYMSTISALYIGFAILMIKEMIS